MLKGITARDMALFESLHSYGMLSTGQIRKLHFMGVDRKTALRRLSILEKRKWIEAKTHWERGEYVWVHTEKAAKHLGSDFTLKGVNRNMLGHDLSLSEVRLAFERYGVGQGWKSGHYLKHLWAKKWRGMLSESENIPDWICSLRTKNGFRTVALEVELHLKSRSRRLEVLQNYAKKEAIQIVWYVFPKERFGHALFEGCADFLSLQRKNWLCWSLLDEVLCDLPHAKVHFPSGSFAAKDLFVIEKTLADTGAPTVGKAAVSEKNRDVK